MCVLCPRPECYVPVNIHEKPKQLMVAIAGYTMINERSCSRHIYRVGDCRFIHLVLEGTEVKLHAKSRYPLIDRQDN